MESTPPNGQIIVEGLVALLFFLGLFLMIHLVVQTDHGNLQHNQKYRGYASDQRKVPHASAVQK